MAFFDSVMTATKYTARERNEGRIRAVATVTEFVNKRRYPKWLFCTGWWVKPQQGWHEKKGTDFTLLYWPYCVCVRGPKVNKEILPDIEFSIPESEFFAYVEIDCGSEGKREFQARCEHYIKINDPVLFVVACGGKARKNDEARLEEIKGWASAIYKTAHFATLKTVQAEPYGKVWDHMVWIEAEQAWEETKSAIPDPEVAAETVYVAEGGNGS